jgi:fructose transport system substrate-binding protein
MVRRALGALLIAFVAAVVAACGGDEGPEVGLITKTETNPFFVKMKEGARREAERQGIELTTATGRFDGDNASQVEAIGRMTEAGVDGILLAPSDTDAIVPAVERAREEGVAVIALDTPTDPEDATDALFATDNARAGELIGEYARSAMGGEEAAIAMLDLNPGITTGDLRHDGFLRGFGIVEGDPQIVCSQYTQGDRERGRAAMEACLQQNPEINLVYTINEPAALGAYEAVEAAGRTGETTIVSVDGGCTGVRAVAEGKIAATSQQYPLEMASRGVEAVAEISEGGDPPSGYTDTGVTLITDEPQAGVESRDTRYGLENCWG